MDTNTDPTTTLPVGRIIAYPRNVHAYVLAPQVLTADCGGDTTLADDGYRYAEFPGTGYRIIVRDSGERTTKWRTTVALVDAWEVDTIAAHRVLDGEWAVLTGLGDKRPGRRPVCRLD